MAEQKIDWLSEEDLKELKMWKEEIFTQMKETFDLLMNTDKLEAFLVLLPEEKRDELYNHPILNTWDLLP